MVSNAKWFGVAAVLATAVVVAQAESKAAVACAARDGLLLRETPMVIAHDAGTTYLAPSEVVGQKELVAFTKTQPDGGFEKLLECGARALDVRAKVDSEGRVIMHHGIVPLPKLLSDAVADVQRWSVSNEGQLVLLYMSHFSGDNAKARALGILKGLGVPILEDAADLANITFQEAHSLGPVVAVVEHVEENYDPSVVCEKGLFAADLASRSLRARSSPFARYVCYDPKTRSVPLQRFKRYLAAVTTAAWTSGLSMAQAHWQYGPDAIALGTLLGSSTILDNSRSGINAMVAEALGEGRYPFVNLLELDNICDGGNAVRQALEARACARPHETAAVDN